VKHVRIAGKRIQMVELYLYLLAALASGVAYVVAVELRTAASPALFSPYGMNLSDAAVMVALATLTKVLMRVYEHSTAASIVRYAQVALTAAVLFFFAALVLFYVLPTTRIPISMVIIFIAADLALGLLILPAHQFFRASPTLQRAIVVIGDRKMAVELANHRLSLMSQKASYWATSSADIARALDDADRSGEKVPFDEIIIDRDATHALPDWSALLKARDQGMLIQTPDAFVESEFGEARLKDATAFDVIVAASSNWNKLRGAVKRVFDLLVGGALFVVLLPVAAIVALVIYFNDGRSIFYRQQRVGLNGRVFRIWKFRTMVVDADRKGPESTTAHDPRVTRVGQFLRRTHLDEIPQLINVLKGEMSLVGPRPQTPGNVTAWSKDSPLYHLRHLVKPGVTGWAQVRFPYVESAEQARVKLSHDLFYVKHHSVALDLLVLALTPRIVLAGEGGR
jgi:exopolysaccharide biosynthesis polyprenyl glycosylphosphotransferase